MKDFNLVLVAYENGAGKEICIAPMHSVTEGDIVETDFGRGKVEAYNFCTANDSIFKLFAAVNPLHFVLSIVKPVVYEENEE